MRKDSVSALGEISTAKNTPVVQASATHGITNKIGFDSDVAGATLEIVDGMFKTTVGTSVIAGVAYTYTREILTYKPGQGALARFSMATSPVKGPGIIPAAGIGGGLISLNSIFGFVDYFGEFSIFTTYNGSARAEELTITAAASGAETATLTVEGVEYTIPLTAGTVEDNAYDIAAYWTEGIDSGWYLDAVGAVITLRKGSTAGGSNDFSLTSTGTAAGTFVSLEASDGGIVDTVAAVKWDNPRLWRGFDPQLANEYAIQANFNSGNVQFFIQNPNTSEYVLVHTLSLAGRVLKAINDSPNYNVGSLILNGSSDEANAVLMGSMAGFTQGEVIPNTTDKSVSKEGIADADVSPLLISIRNQWSANNVQNLVTIIPKTIQVFSSDTAMRIKVYKNADLIGDGIIRPNFELTSDSDVLAFDTVANEFTPAGTPIKYGYTGNSGTSAGLAEIDLEELNLQILPGDTFHVEGAFIDTMAVGTLVDVVVAYEEG
jgi:hypothetical protein